ncbi:DNA-directed RNA polymerase subunit omega [bacterium]|nr:DNA-directed RNA polymerase subunit omega [bacterium]
MSDVVILEDLFDIVDNKFLAANMAAKRARYLNEKRKLPIIKTEALKETTIALEELLLNKLDYRIIQPEEPGDTKELISFEPPVPEEELGEQSESLLDEEYIDDRDIFLAEEDPEEGI